MSDPTPAPDSIDVRVRDETGVRIAAVSGSAGAELASELIRKLQEVSESASRLVLDLSGLTFINSEGLGAFIEIHRHCRELGGMLCLAAPRPSVAQVLRVTRIDRLIVTCPDVPKARAAITAHLDHPSAPSK
ncbi:MAG: STAS domain-containing protein [Phycisphaerae bacterium]